MSKKPVKHTPPAIESAPVKFYKDPTREENQTQVTLAGVDAVPTEKLQD